MTDERPDEDGGGGADPGRPERPRLRTRPLGYKRSDVDEALEARDAQLTELRQDVAALWLAFAQHDRMIRSLSGEELRPVTATDAPSAGATAEPAEADPPSDAVDTEAVAAEAESIGNQLSELDEVLAAIEMATKTLESTYAAEVEEGRREDPRPAAGADESAEDDAERPEPA